MSSYTLHKNTLLPSGVSKAAAITILHDHATMLHLNPLVRSSVLIPSQTGLSPHKLFPSPEHPPNSPPSVYEVTELVNGGRGATYSLLTAIGKGELKFTASMLDTPVGLRTEVEAPMGFRSFVDWSVREAREEDLDFGNAEGVGGNNDGRQGQRFVLVEVASIFASYVLVAFAKPSLEASHEVLHRGFVDRLAAKT